MGLKQLKERWKDANRVIKDLQAKQEEAKQIITTEDFQGDNYNKLMEYIDYQISQLLQGEITSLCRRACYAKELGCTLSRVPFLISGDYADKKMKKICDRIFEITAKRVSRESYKKYVILKVLDELLNISSIEEFGDRHYKIGDIEVNSFEDLQKHKKVLEGLRESTYRDDIPLLKETMDYAGKKGFVIQIYG